MSIPFTFVHGGASDDAKQFLPQKYWKCDVEAAVKDFNEGKIQCLIGTSAISTGVDLLPVGCLIYLQGGTSEIKVRQAIGRGTRIIPGKKPISSSSISELLAMASWSGTSTSESRFTKTWAK